MQFLRSLRVQALLTIGLGILAPYALLAWQRPTISLDYTAARLTLLSSIAATCWALLFARRYSRLPFRSGWNLTLPVFSISYAIVITVFLIGRIPYSIIVFVAAFACSNLVYFLIFTQAQKNGDDRYYCVPGGRIDSILALKTIPVELLVRPEVPQERNAILIADLHHDHADEWERMLARAALDGVPVFHAKQVWEEINGRVLIEHLSENNFGTLLPNMPWLKLKRAIDSVAVLLLLPFLAIPLLVVAMLIKIDSAGPVMFRQVRIGYRGRPFRVLKFRTMRVSQPEQNASGREHAKTVANDDRITRFGSFLRRTRIDELPQMLNILTGDMSWIGPRPEAEELAQWYEGEIPFYSYRHIVRPGITGWAQVNQGHVTEIDDVSNKLQYDFYYIRNFSPTLDTVIVLRTIRVVLTGFGHK